VLEAEHCLLHHMCAVEAMRLFFDCGSACRGSDSAFRVHGSASRVLKIDMVMTNEADFLGFFA
jgi:hypothetical protein